MTKWMRKHNKHLLAVLGVFLMISFVATLGYRGPSGRTRNDTVVAFVGKKPIYRGEVENAKDEWAVLMRIGVRSQAMFGQQVPLPYAALPFMVQDVDKHPELFLLLQRKAQENGITVTPDNAKEFWVNVLHRPLEMMQPIDVSAIQSFLAVYHEYQSLGQTVKVSEPAWQHEAQQYQNVRLNLVDFRADEFEKTVPNPTPQQLQEFFDKNKNIPPRQPDSSTGGDSLGFGYQIPPRVRLQYLTIPHAQVEQSLAPTPEKQYEWAVKAAEYYNGHQDEFKNTPPTTAPSTQSSSTQPTTQEASTQPSSQPTTLASSQPVIKPFDEVKQQIVSKLMSADVAKQSAAIEKEIESQLASEWKAIAQSNLAATQPAATQPASEAASQPALPQMTLASLERLRADIQQKMQVSIDLHEINTWQTSQNLGTLPGIGTADTADHAPFREYALSFTGQPITVSTAALQVWEPSQPLTDTQENAYIFRLTAAEPAHAPPDMAAVAQQVTKDWKTAQAYELAKQAALKLLNSAKSMGLAQAAPSSGAIVVSTGQFAPRSGAAIPGYKLTDPAAQATFDRGAQKLLELATPSDQRPDTIIELPGAQRVVVAELASAQLIAQPWLIQLEVTRTQQQMAQQKLADDWFSYDAVVSRMGYKAEERQQGKLMTIQEAYEDAERHHSAGRLQQAEFLAQQILARQRDHAAALHLMGLIWHQYGRSAQAVSFIHRATERDPDSADFYNSLATVLNAQEASDAAVVAAQRALSLRPDFAEAQFNLGIALAEKGETDQAISHFRQTLTLKPVFPDAELRLGDLLKQVGQLDDALACYSRAAATTSGPRIASKYVHTLSCEYAADSKRISQDQARWNLVYARPLVGQIRPHDNDRSPDRQLRIGYVSPNFRQHPIGRFFAPVLANHDRRQFEVHCYSDVRRPDELTRHLDSLDGHWRSTVGVADHELSEIIRADSIDILVDLTLHMEVSRLLTFALKPAPVQTTYLACPGSSSLQTIDYRFVDAYLDPLSSGRREGEAPAEPVPMEAERPIYLTSYWCYEPPAQSPEIGPLPARNFGHVTFGCLNDFSKLSQATWTAWRQLLTRLPNSRLIVQAPRGGHRDGVRAQFAADGIDPHRVQFIDPLPFQSYLEQYSQIDIALDPFPCNGQITTCDALWMGVPVVSLAGQSWVSRAGLSILSQVGLADLVAKDSEQYAQIVLALAGDTNRLANLRSTLRQRMQSSPLMDAVSHTREMEAAMRQMWRRWCQRCGV